MILSCGLALTMAPATESIMGSLPLAKAGVGSAVNDTTRQVGGAVGVAVLGSMFNSIYTSSVTDGLSGSSLPVERARHRQGLRRRRARRSRLDRWGGRQPGGAGGPGRLRRRSPVRVRAGAVVTLIGVVVTLIWLPARARGRDVTLQAGEFADEHPELRPDHVPAPEPSRGLPVRDLARLAGDPVPS